MSKRSPPVRGYMIISNTHMIYLLYPILVYMVYC